ncbi:hypothetical protein EON65_36675 [archaeon]|nr:MAG: hypothetical protein EON65_36675 [archaeon]
MTIPRMINRQHASNAANNLSIATPAALEQQGSIKNSTTMDILSSMVSSSSGPGSITITYYLVNLPHYARVLNNITVDGAKYRALKNAFVFSNTHTLFNTQTHTHNTLGSPGHRYSNSKHSNKDKRVLQKLMSGEGLEAKELVAQINQKFYQTISG